MKELRQISEINKISSEDISDAVAKAPAINDEISKELLSFESKFALGQALAFAGKYDDSFSILTDLAAEKATRNLDYAKKIWWHAGWAAWLADEDEKAADIFRKILMDSSGSPVMRENWRFSEWIASWFLGKVTDDEFIKSCSGKEPDTSNAPYFFIGEKLLKAGKNNEAKMSYQRCLDISEKSNDTWPANWARWRIKQIEGIK